MQFDEGDPRRGYLHSALADGARPFRYRGAVSSLLGVPASEGRSLVLSPVLPPVGFRYAERPVRIASFRSPQYPPNKTGNQAFCNEQVGETEDRPRVSLGNAETREPGIKHESETTTTWDKDWRSVKPEAVAEKSSLEVPAVSQKRTYFGDVFHSSKGIMPSAGYEEQPHDLNKELTHWHQVPPYENEKRVSALSRNESGAIVNPGATNNSLREKVSVATKTDGSLPSDMLAAEKEATSGQTGTLSVEQASEIGSMANSMAAPLSNVQAGEYAVDSINSPQKTMRHPVAGRHMDLRGESGTGKRHDFWTVNSSFFIAAQKAADILESPNVSPHAAEKSNQDAYEKIERLRHNLHELAAKGPSRQPITKNETASNASEQTPHPLPQPVMIVRQPVTEHRVPRAFWERSYLSRFHLRLLR